MPAVIPKHVHLRNLLRDETRAAFGYAERLESVLAVKSRGSSEVFHGKIDHSQPPWNAPAAGLIMELHAWTRFTERLWRRCAGLPARPRGGSHLNTWKALQGLYGLSEAVDDALVAEDTRWLSSWCRRASIVLGETESLKRLPRLPVTGKRCVRGVRKIVCGRWRWMVSFSVSMLNAWMKKTANLKRNWNIFGVTWFCGGKMG